MVDTIFLQDCLEGMKAIPTGSVDLILTDLPYGTTKNKWDNVIPFDALWAAYERIIKEHGAIILFCDGMFTAKLICSNPKLWRYNLVWDKQRGCDFLNANVKPMKCHEDIAVFYKKSLFTTSNFGIQIHIRKRKMGHFLKTTEIVIRLYQKV